MEKKARTPKKGLEAAWQEYPSLTPFHRASSGKLDPKDRASRWVVLEKVHGANFCFVTNDTEVAAARRTAVLSPYERFYCWQSVLAKYEASFKNLLRRVRAVAGLNDITEVCVFGELFGGAYPHPEVACKDLPAVQKGVYYSPDIDFFAFDVQAVRASGKRVWIDFNITLELFKECGLFHAEALAEGTAFNTRINSTIPAALGLPPLAKNQMEGVVIKAMETVYFLDLDPQDKPVRAAFKKKNQQFDEVNPRPTDFNAGATPSNKKRLKERGDVLEEMERYININRLHSLESKIGPVTEDLAQEASRELAEDALKDFIADNPEMWAGLDKRGQEIRCKRFRARVELWLRGRLAASDLNQ